MTVNAHFMVAETAKAMAHELYDIVMTDNVAYASWKDICPELTPKLAEKKFVELLVPFLLDDAVTTLATMLRGSLPEVLKNQIADALMKDASLGRRVRKSPARQHLTIH